MFESLGVASLICTTPLRFTPVRYLGAIYLGVKIRHANFVTKKLAFAGEDIHCLRSRRLYCPDPALVNHIEPEHASRMFKETVR
jgi:hypothetical protein